MRACPNCSQEIQDEAVYCRHCRTELEPPLWLTSMRRCPYCAEWIESYLEQCTHCDRSLFAAGAAHAAPFLETSSAPEDITPVLRQKLLDDDIDDNLEDAAAIAAAAAEFVAEEPSVPMADLDAEASALSEEPQEGVLSDPELEASTYDQPHSELRRALYDEPQEGALHGGSAEEPEAGIDEDPQSSLRRSLYDEPQEVVTDDAPLEGSESAIFDVSQPDLRSSLYDEPLDHVGSEESSINYASEDEDTEIVEPPVAVGTGTDSSNWMAGAVVDDDAYLRGTGPLTARVDDLGRSKPSTDGAGELRADVLGLPGRIGRSAGNVARILIIVAVLGAAILGLVTLAKGPAGAWVSEALAIDVPTDRQVPEITSTRRTAPTLPPVTEESAIVPTEAGTTSSDPGCVLWDAITPVDEGSEFCAYGVIKRWWAVDDLPFIAIFSEEEGTFAIIDSTIEHPVAPGSCIMARGTVEIMGGVRPNIDARGVLEECPADFVEE